ncbi:LacI family DNA-binding transcriptional regulator [Limosilactobacillus difficilis]|uniref:LacI family DNA-binding transcriptional regulator n=1 Tax=Limosilactobacillus difficilis TaxID=2991838 RepID=UPI0024B91125|nr:LacI family DNA-binding transcriptional regulator [Limosilactobacillus difficilis]
MITIKDVADRAGYAKSTVSRYINSSGYVAQQTGVAIQKAIDDLDYHPNQIARELSMGETHRIGVVVSYAKHPYINQIMRGLLDYAMKAHYELLFLPSQYQLDRERQYLRQLRGHDFDALIFTSHEISLHEIAQYRHYGQIICLEDASAYGLSSVYVDRHPGYREMFRFLQPRHLQKMAILFYRDSPNSPTYQQTLSNVRHYLPGVHFQTFHGVANFGDASKIMPQLVAGRFDCILATNDDVAAELVQKLSHLTTQIPLIVSQGAQLSGDLLRIPSICDQAYELDLKLGKVAGNKQTVKISLPPHFEQAGHHHHLKGVSS